MSDLPSASSEPDWAQRTTEFIVGKVDDVAAKTADPARVASRAVVYGLVIAVLGPTLLILFLALTVRLLSAYVPGDVYYVYLGIGAVFAALGIFLMRKAART